MFFSTHPISSKYIPAGEVTPKMLYQFGKKMPALSSPIQQFASYSFKIENISASRHILAYRGQSGKHERDFYLFLSVQIFWFAPGCEVVRGSFMAVTHCFFKYHYRGPYTARSAVSFGVGAGA